MSDLAADHRRNADQAEINARWADDPRLRIYWKDLASTYRRLAAAAEQGPRRSKPIVQSGVNALGGSVRTGTLGDRAA